MKSLHRLTPAPVNAVILGCVWISVVQCTVLSSCLTSCVTNLVSFTHLLFVFAGTRARSRLYLRFIFSSGHPLFLREGSKKILLLGLFFSPEGRRIYNFKIYAGYFIYLLSLSRFFFFFFLGIQGLGKRLFE